MSHALFTLSAPSAQYEKLVGTGRALALSPFDLKQQVLVKGKAKLGTTTKKRAPCRDAAMLTVSPVCTCIKSARTLVTPCAAPNPEFRRGKLFSIQGSLASLHRSVSSCETTPSAVPRTTLSCGSSRASTTSAVEAMVRTRTVFPGKRIALRSSPSSERTFGTILPDAQEKTRRRLYRSSAGHGAPNETNSGSWSRTTDEFYTSLIGLRSETMSSFCGGGPPTWAVPVTSISEKQVA
jgi:hypothetical protein